MTFLKTLPQNLKFPLLMIFGLLNFYSANAQIHDTIPRKSYEINEGEYIPGSFALSEAARNAYEVKIQEQRSLKFFFMTAFLLTFVFAFMVVLYLTNTFKKKMEELTEDTKITLREAQLAFVKNKQLSLILNNIENAVAIATPKGEITWVNDGFVSLYGYSLEELKEENKLNLIEVASEKEKGYFNTCIELKENFGYTSETEDLYGTTIYFQRNLIPVLDDNNEVVNLVAADNDLTMVKIAMNQINEQKKKVEQQKKNMTDSINYASYIQRALLPSDSFMQSLFPDSFTLFRPRDIVSGDFYWAIKTETRRIVVAADSTGHGVPGAFMSVLGLSLLNEVMAKAEAADEILTAGEILNRLRTGVISALNESGKKSTTKDGMDLSLCIFEDGSNKIQFAGAHNSALVLRKEDNEDLPDIIRLKADRMPIGVFFKGDKEFQTEEFELEKGDILYLHSDGYPDQFGGPKDNKYMIKRMKMLLQQIFHKPLAEQKEIMNTQIENWMNESGCEQVDDILVMAIKIN